jgi:hypothetical protein
MPSLALTRLACIPAKPYVPSRAQRAARVRGARAGAAQRKRCDWPDALLILRAAGGRLAPVIDGTYSPRGAADVADAAAVRRRWFA